MAERAAKGKGFAGLARLPEAWDRLVGNPAGNAEASVAEEPDVRVADVRGLLEVVLTATDRDVLTAEVLERVKALLEADTATMFLYDGALQARLTLAPDQPRVADGATLHLVDPLAQSVFSTGQVQVARRSEGAMAPPDEALGLWTAAAAPMRVKGVPLGVIHVRWFKDAAPTPRELEILQDAADWLALGIERLRVLDVERETRQKADEASRFRAQLLQMAGHDLAAPLRVLALHANWLTDERTSPELRAKAARVIRRTVSRLQFILEDILDMARLEGSHLVLHRTRFDLSHVVSQATETYGGLAREFRLTLVPEVEPGMEVDGDKARIVQMVADLVTQAIWFNPRDSTIRLQCRREDGQAVLRLHATVPELSEDQQAMENLRLGRKRDESSEQGLGMYLAKAIVEQHGGSLALHGAIGTNGSSLEVRMPLAQSVPASPA